MNTIKGRKRFENSSLENSQVAAGIREIHAQNGLSRRAGNRRRYAAQPIVRAISPHAANHVAVGKQSEHARQISRVILEIAIECREDFPMTGLEAGPQSGALATVLRMPKGPQARVNLPSLENLLPGIVAAGVIHEN